MTPSERLGLPPRWDPTCHDEMTGTAAWAPAERLTRGEARVLAIRVNADIAPAVAQLAAMGHAFVEAIRPMAEALVQVAARLVDAGVVPDQPPTDPKARALHAVRHRNTGPTVHADPRRNR